jgi:hypothetical protein
MARLFLILVKKFGYAAARKMAPKYGISQRVVNKTLKDSMMAQPRQIRQGNVYGSPDEDIEMLKRMFPSRPTQTFAQRKAGRMVRPDRQQDFMNFMKATAVKQPSNMKNIDKIIADAKNVGKAGVRKATSRKPLMEPPYDKRDYALMAGLLGTAGAVKYSGAADRVWEEE